MFFLGFVKKSLRADRNGHASADDLGGIGDPLPSTEARKNYYLYPGTSCCTTLSLHPLSLHCCTLLATIVARCALRLASLPLFPACDRPKSVEDSMKTSPFAILTGFTGERNSALWEVWTRDNGACSNRCTVPASVSRDAIYG